MRSLVKLRHLEPSPFYMFNRFNEDFYKDIRDIFDMSGDEERFTHRNFSPTCDLSEEESHYMLSFDVPGIAQEDIEVEVLDGRLSIKGERKHKKEEGSYVESKYGKFHRVISLPQDVNQDEIEAKYENGVLSLALPKLEKALPKTIKIGATKKEGIWNRLLGKNEDQSVEVSKLDSAS